jgi:hypothetical protein
MLCGRTGIATATSGSPSDNERKSKSNCGSSIFYGQQLFYKYGCKCHQHSLAQPFNPEVAEFKNLITFFDLMECGTREHRNPEINFFLKSIYCHFIINTCNNCLIKIVNLQWKSRQLLALYYQDFGE